VYGDLPLGPVDWRRNDDLTTPEYARIHGKSARPQQHDPNQHRPRENHSETGIKHRGRARRQQRERYADSAQTDGGASNRREKAYQQEYSSGQRRETEEPRQRQTPACREVSPPCEQQRQAQDSA